VLAALLLGASAASWTAIAAWVGVAIALIAAYVGLSQVSEARSLREQQAQPYVVAFLDASAVGPMYVDLVVKNFGATAARSVRVMLDPSPQRAVSRGNEAVWMPDLIPLLVPGQEWRHFWDFTDARLRSDPALPDKYNATFSFADRRGRAFSEQFVLDWEPITQRASVVAHSPHDAVQAMREIRQTLAGWNEGVMGGALRVIVRDGEALDIRRREGPAGRQWWKPKEPPLEPPQSDADR
jgi:hypothetical protein